MRTHISTLVVAAALGITAQQAAAVVTFAFADNPDPNGQFLYEAPNANHPASGILAYNSAVTIDLAIDATGEGGNEYEYTDATFEFFASVGTFGETQVPGIYLAPLTNGFFSFSAADNARAGDLLMTGSFGTANNPAYLVIVVDTGAINVSALVGGLQYEATELLKNDLRDPALGGIDTPVDRLGAPHDAVWTLTNLSNLATRYINNGVARGVFLENFIANSSYSGTTSIIVPTPATAALAGLGLAVAGFRRRR